MPPQPSPEPLAKLIRLDLVRVAVGDEGAFGMLVRGVVPIAVTCERTYEVASEGEYRQVTKIPLGRYRCERTMYHRGGYPTYEITGVVGHSRLLFHAGNVELDSEGCILVGRGVGALHGVPAVLDSRVGFAAFMAELGGAREFELVVRQA